MSVLGESAARRRPGTAGLVFVTLLALLVSIAVVGLVGGRRHALPAGLARPGLIAFDSAGDIFVSAADGTPARPLTSGPDSDIEAVFSPDGTRIAYLSLVAGTSQVTLNVVAADATTQPPTVVVGLAASRYSEGPLVPFIHIAWSPDSTRIAYTAMAEAIPSSSWRRWMGAPPCLSVRRTSRANPRSGHRTVVRSPSRGATSTRIEAST